MRLAVRRFVPIAACACLAVGFTAFGCSLGLDASLIGQDAAGVRMDDVLQDGAVPIDGGDGKAPSGDAAKPDAPINVDAGACNTNTDCQGAAAAGGACVTSANCDTTSHTCTLDVCGNAANCQAAVCLRAELHDPATYGFAPASFQVTAGGIGGFGVQYSIAAAWPFVFVVTTNGLTAYNVVDPTNPTPPVVPLQGVPFIPVATLAVGRRVYFLTGTQGGPTAYRQAVAWVDVPRNPLMAALQATSAFVTTPDSPLANVFSDDSNGLFFLYGGAMLEPTANVAPPLDDTTMLTPFPNTGLPTGASLVASTGGRLISYRYATYTPPDDGAAGFPVANFTFVKSAGTTSAVTTPNPDFPLVAFGALDGQAGFATGGDGSVLWETAILDPVAGIDKARLSWLVDSAAAGNFDSTSYVDLVTYNPPAAGQVVGQPAWIDANTALGFAALSSIQTSTTLVQVAYKTPASIDPVRTTQLGVPPGAIGVATSDGFAYALLQNDPMNRSCTVQIIAPSCGGADQ